MTVLFAVTAYVPHALAAPAPADWNYRVRPGDNLWDLAARYLKPDVPWQKLQDYNQVGDPLHLPPGSTMHFPVGWLRQGPAPATVVAVLGSATAKPPRQRAGDPGNSGYVGGLRHRAGHRSRHQPHAAVG
ncbi:LysM peptidoglycan-binding domain-containing protein [Dyella terrae]|uniref:LysM peptidoglycan-binding domain-containing protein n=1 Tax=Dyella terrae TaxID=522259 RepID=UPI001EFD0CD8|nr:LysM peptidoglycan-binding domain-containing protein [Dyella terrae]